jgi:hypothetical protein
MGLGGFIPDGRAQQVSEIGEQIVLPRLSKDESIGITAAKRIDGLAFVPPGDDALAQKHLRDKRAERFFDCSISSLGSLRSSFPIVQW